MRDDRKPSEPRPPGPKRRGPRPIPDPQPRPYRGPENGVTLQRLANLLDDVVSTPGRFRPAVEIRPRPALRAAARDVLVAAARLSEVARKSLESGRLTEEQAQLAARVGAWTGQFRLVALAVLRALGDEPPGEGAAPPLTDPAVPP
jgi:hypothetical protein